MAKLVDDRARSSRIVGAAITEHSAPIGASMRTALQPFLREGETMPDVGFLLILVGRLLLARAGKLITANSALELEGTDDAEPRARRDGKDRSLRSRVSLIRKARGRQRSWQRRGLDSGGTHFRGTGD